jgi:hypothetical protein
MTSSQDEATNLRSAYDQLCLSYRAIDDFRAKLLGFLPLVTGGGLVLLTGKADGLAKVLFLPIGVFGIAVTLGLFSYEIYGIKKCHALIEVGQTMETSLGLDAGQFRNRPREVLRHINEPFAAAIIYPAVIAAWTYLATFQSARWLSAALALVVFAVGFALTVEYNRRLGRDAMQPEAVPAHQQPGIRAALKPDNGGLVGGREAGHDETSTTTIVGREPP